MHAKDVVKQCVAVAGGHFGVLPALILSDKRSDAIVQARDTAIGLAHERMKWAKAGTLGRWFDRDRTSICIALRRIAARRADAEFGAAFLHLLAQVPHQTPGQC